MARLLIIEDDADIRELISFNLEMSGHTVDKARDGEKGLAMARSSAYDLILLDLMLPGMDGLKVCNRLKGDPVTQAVPVIMLTARSEDDDVIMGLGSGADDYITKPFNPRVLLARVKAVLRRNPAESSIEEDVRVQVHGIAINPLRHEVLVGEESINFSATEFAILYFLARNPGWVFSRNQIIDSVKGDDYPVTARSVDVQILGIRKKLGEYGDVVETVRGVGYRVRSEKPE